MKANIHGSDPLAYVAENFFNAKAAFTFWKGRVALYSALKAMQIGAGSKVIVAGYTCSVVPAAVKALQAQPVYVDIDPRTYNIAPTLLDAQYVPNVKVLIVQHTYGIPAEMDRISNWAKEKGISIIEDCVL